MKFPKLRAGGKKIPRGEFEKEQFVRDMNAFRAARDVYCQARGISWKGIKTKEEKRRRIETIRKILENLPNLTASGSELAKAMSEELSNNGYSPEEALKFAHYLKSIEKETRSRGRPTTQPQPGQELEPQPEPDQKRNVFDDSGERGSIGVYGHVKDAGTKQSIPHAPIDIEGPEVHSGNTNEAGRYNKAIQMAGDYTVKCSPEGYEEGEASVHLDYREGWKRQDFNLKMKPRAKSRVRRMADSTEGRIGPHFRQFIMPFALIMAGVMISYVSGCMWMMMGFISWALLCLVPEPATMSEFRDKGLGIIIGEERSSDPRKFRATMRGLATYFGNHSSGLGFFRSMLKITAICLFVAAVKFCVIPFQGILLPILAFAGYFWMRGEVRRDNPGTVIEALIRFSILGCFVIPFWIFWSQFNSLSLAFIALAFFAVPPVYKSEAEGERDLMGLFSKMWFALVMLVALFGSGVVSGFSLGPSWELHGALKVTFIYFWVVCGVAGFFSSHEARPTIGLFMLLVATLIYGMSAGTQDVGMGLFGPYFPQVFKTVTDIMKPLNDAFSQMSGTFGTAWQLLANPVGFANQMMNSSYSKDPLSKVTGPLGVELDGFRTTPIYPYSPFSAIVKIRNRGASDARNITVSISAFELWSPKEQKVSVIKERLVLGELGFGPYSGGGTEVTCYDEYGANVSDPMRIVTCSQAVDGGGPLKRLDIRQVIFMTPFDKNKEFGTQGLSCETVNKYALRESRFRRKWGIQFIPLQASVAYDYSMGSNLDASFISADEWSRMTEDEEAFVPQRKEAATNTNSPAQLKLDTLEQPIREGTPFHVGLALESSQNNGKVADVYSIGLNIPAELAELLDFCMPETDGELGGGPEGEANPDGSVTLEWSNRVKKRSIPFNIIFCNFRGRDLAGNASSSFLIQANASFRFSTSDTEITNVEWGGGIACCTKDSHCPYPDLQVCDQATEQCKLREEGEEMPYSKLGDADYCAAKKESYPEDRRMWCGEGEGKCSLEGDECREGLVCTQLSVDGKDTSLCCYEGKENECMEAYKANLG